ncbi:MAG: hypothetical protein K8R21_15490, partial [Leptospira sp.]|nr:hypothetical protein [Leptospira sp.]
VGVVRETGESVQIIDIDPDPADNGQNNENVDSYYTEAKKFLRDGEMDEAIKILSAGYRINQSNQQLNKLLGLLSFKGKDYNTAVDLLGKYLDYDPDIADFWYYLSVAEKKLGRYDSSMQAAIKLKGLQPDNVPNLINLSDLNRLKGNVPEAKVYCDDALKLDPGNKNAKKLFEILNR